MGKWEQYKTYETWKSANDSDLTSQHKEYLDKHYDWVQPDTHITYDDFCMGVWQSMD